MRITYSAAATDSALGETPTQNTPRQTACRPMKGTVRSQSIEPSLASDTVVSAPVSNQRRSALKDCVLSGVPQVAAPGAISSLWCRLMSASVGPLSWCYTEEQPG